MNFSLKIWRQKDGRSPGSFKDYDAKNIPSGNCRNYYECEAVCPAEISATFISRLNLDYAIAAAKEALAV